MRKAFCLAAALLVFVPSLALAGTFSLRVGYYMPSFKSVNPENSLWDIEFENMSFNKKDFRGVTLGIGYEYFVNKQISLAITVDTFNRDRIGYYRDYVGYPFTEGDFAFFVDDLPSDLNIDAFDVIHGFKIGMTPVQLSLRFTPLGRKSRLIPFVGGGAGLYFWSVELRGEIIDFADEYIYTDPVAGDIPVYPVLADQLGRERGQTLGFHAFGGIQIPLGYRWTLEAEARYHWIKARLGAESWFQGFEDMDLGGLALTVGFNYWF